MDRKWLPLNALRAFEAAGQHLSFTAAANRLTVAQSAVSRHVIMLERFLNAPLFERRPQQLVLTEAGKHLLPVVVKAFDRIDQAIADIVKEKGNPRRVLKVALPPTFAHQLAVPLLKDFRAEHPEVSIDIASRRTRAGADGEADLSVIYSEPRVTDTVLDLLWMVRLTVLCSPALLKGGAPTDITTFVAGHDLLHVKLDDRRRHYLWGMAARAMARPDMAVDRGPFSTQRSWRPNTPCPARAWRSSTPCCFATRSPPAAWCAPSTSTSTTATATTSPPTPRIWATSLSRCSALG